MDEYLIDHMQEREEQNLQTAIRNRAKLAPNQKFTDVSQSPYQDCEGCGDSIEDFRMLCGLPRCTECQDKFEKLNKHFGR